MTKAQKQKWQEVAVGAAGSLAVFVVLWHVLGRGVLFGSPGGDVQLLGASGTLGELLGSALVALVAFLGFVGRHVLAFVASVQAKASTRSAKAGCVSAEAVDGTCQALIEHLRAGRERAALSAFKSLAHLVGPAEHVWSFHSDQAEGQATSRKR